LIEKLRRIPAPGETIPVGGVQIEIVQATDRAVEAVRITKKKK